MKNSEPAPMSVKYGSIEGMQSMGLADILS